MIKNFWKKIVLICGNHPDEEILMNLIEGPSSLFYACPKYYPENRTPNERACANRINLVDFEKMVDHLSELYEENFLEGNLINLTGHRWVYKKVIEYEVIEHTQDQIKVKMKNKKALR